MSARYQSESISIQGKEELHVSVANGVVILSRTVDGVDAQDTLATLAEAIAYRAALDGAIKFLESNQ